MKSPYQFAPQGRYGFGRLATTFALVGAGLLAASFAQTAGAQTLLAGYDFQTTTNGGTAAVAEVNGGASSPLVYYSGFGNQTGSTGGAAIYLDGTHGSTAFTSTSTAPQVTAFAGSTVNETGNGSGFSATTSGAASLAVANSSSNGNRIVFTLSTTGYQSLMLSYATQKSGTSGFNADQFSYSTDGVTFTPFGSAFAPATAFAVVTEDFTSITALNNASTVYIGLTLGGATSTSGNNRLDNIQFNATAITSAPEPTTVIGGALAFGAFGWSQRRRLMGLARRARA